MQHNSQDGNALRPVPARIRTRHKFRPVCKRLCPLQREEFKGQLALLPSEGLRPSPSCLPRHHCMQHPPRHRSSEFIILFVQLVSSTVDINQQGAAPLNIVTGIERGLLKVLIKFRTIFLNLNIFGNLLPPFCFPEGLNMLDVIALRYAEAFFPVVIIVATLLLLRCQRYLKMPGIKLFSRSVPHNLLARH